MAGAGPEVIQQFVAELHRRTAHAGMRESADSLTLAEAALRLGRAPSAAGRPLQVALIGPTQVGKSTVFNLLLGREVSPVSPLARARTGDGSRRRPPPRLDCGHLPRLAPNRAG
jgi:ribosome biogenesis GTPase A